VTAWLPYWEMPAALRSTLDNSAVIGTASPYWYDISGDSHVHLQQGAGSQSVIQELLAHHQQILPMVTEASGIKQFARILASPARSSSSRHTPATRASTSTSRASPTTPSTGRRSLTASRCSTRS
jgi:hypothetical protein